MTRDAAWIVRILTRARMVLARGGHSLNLASPTKPRSLLAAASERFAWMDWTFTNCSIAPFRSITSSIEKRAEVETGSPFIRMRDLF